MEIIISVETTVEFSQDELPGFEVPETASNSVLLTNESQVESNHKRVANAISFSHLVQTPISRSLSNGISFGQQVVVKTLTFSVNSNINLSQNVRKSIDSESRSNSITLGHNVSYKIDPIRLSVVTNLDLEQEVSTSGTSVSKAVANTLSLTHKPSTVKSKSASNAFTLSQDVLESFGEDSNITLGQSVVANNTKTGISSLTFGHTVLVNKVKALQATNTIILQHSVVPLRYVGTEVIVSTCEYAPILGVGSPVSSSPIAVSLQSDIEITFGMTSVTLRTMNFGNSEIKDYARIIRESRGGTLQTYRRSVWPKQTILKYTISFNSNNEVNDFLNLLNDCVGQNVTLRDHLNREWVGILDFDDIQFTHASRANRELTFNFEGNLL